MKKGISSPFACLLSVDFVTAHRIFELAWVLCVNVIIIHALQWTPNFAWLRHWSADCPGETAALPNSYQICAKLTNGVMLSV